TGHAPAMMKTTPVAKHIPPISSITARKPGALSERCGVSTAENNVGSSRTALSGVMAILYSDTMAKRTLSRNRTPARRKAAAPRKPLKTTRKPPAKVMRRRGRKTGIMAGGAARSLTAAEIEEAFRRFQAANPEPEGELKHVDPYTLLVAVVLSAQATDAG